MPHHIKGPVKIIQGNDFSNTQYPIYLCGYFDKSMMTFNVWNKLYSRNMIKNLARLPAPPIFLWVMTRY